MKVKNYANSCVINMVAFELFVFDTGTVTVFTSSFNFGMAYTCGVLLLPVILLAFTRTVSFL